MNHIKIYRTLVDLTGNSIVFTPEGIFSSNLSAAKYYNVHEATMLGWCGHNKSKPQLIKDGFHSQKVYMSTNEIKEKYNVKA